MGEGGLKEEGGQLFAKYKDQVLISGLAYI